MPVLRLTCCLAIVLLSATAATAGERRFSDDRGKTVVRIGKERFDGSRRINDDRGRTIGTLEPDRLDRGSYWIEDETGRRVGRVTRRRR